ncbi:MAG TPA: CVNH domain-containing protein [Candidatus Angelobacter sp.]
MRSILRCWAVGVMCVVGLGIASNAQSNPPGSYQQTCRNIDFHDDVLAANCQDSSGRWQSAQLRDVQSCRSDIINDDGALRCSRSGGVNGGVAAGLPGGSYSQSCQDVHAHGDDLEARCPTTNGDWKDTKLDDYNKCRGEIVNDNGKLRCVTGVYGAPGAPVGAYQGGYGVPAGAFSGPYTQNCKDIKSHGDDLEARCKTVNGDWHNTKLDDYRKCKGQIINEDGNLKCVAAVGRVGYPGSYQGNWPAGSYTQSCDSIRIDGDDLKAHCQTRDGGARDAKLDDFQKCKSDIINDDGKLHCER